MSKDKKAIPPIRNFTREQLNHRHRLSHQQIDDVLGGGQAKFYLEDKLGQLSDLKVFLDLTDRLKVSNIDFLNIKGPLLSQRIYGDPIYRYYKDFDILVSRGEMTKAIGLIEQMGFVPAEYSWPTAEKRQHGLMDMVSHFSLFHPETGVNIEVHWKLFNQPIVDEKLMDSIIKANTEELIFSGRTFQVFNKELELLYLIIHGSKHAWFRLKWLLDVVEYVKRIPIDKEVFHKLAKTLKVERMVSLTNELTSCYFDPIRKLPMDNRSSPFLVNFAKQKVEDREESSYQDFFSLLKYLKYKTKLHTYWKYRIGLFKLSTLPPALVNHPWWPLKTLPVIGFKVLEKMKLV